MQLNRWCRELGGLVAVCSLVSCDGSRSALDRQRFEEKITNRTSLASYASCTDVEQDLKQLLIDRLETQLRASGDPTCADCLPLGEDNGGPVAQAPLKDQDYSGTNNQENGVDEGDIVKTDGQTIYLLNGNRLHLFDVPTGGLEPLLTVDLNGTAVDLLIDSAHAIGLVVSYIDAYAIPVGHPLRAKLGVDDPNLGWIPHTYSIYAAQLIDLSNRANPTLRTPRFYFEGSPVVSRLIGSTALLASFGWSTADQSILNTIYSRFEFPYDREEVIDFLHAEVAKLTLDDLVPRYYEERTDGTLLTHSISDNNCIDFSRPTASRGSGVTSLYSIDLASPDFSNGSHQIVSNYPTVYAADGRLVVAESAFDWWWYWYTWNQDSRDQTDLHLFDISNPAAVGYIASGRINGTIHNSFALSWYNDLLRVVSTTDVSARVWDQVEPLPTENLVSVLAVHNGELVVQDSDKLKNVDGNPITDERVFASRFNGNTGYVVTFRNIDPLFTLDFSDSTDPVKQVGSLDVFGVSTYLHPLEGGHLLTVGTGGDENGLNWQTQVSLFDVHKLSDPQPTDTISFGDGSSEAQYNHKAFQYWAPKKLLSIPFSTYVESIPEGSSDPIYTYSSRLELVNVDPGVGLTSRGHIDQSDCFNRDPSRQWYSTDIRRTIFMGDYLYAISDACVTVHKLDAELSYIKGEELPGYWPEVCFPGWE